MVFMTTPDTAKLFLALGDSRVPFADALMLWIFKLSTTIIACLLLSWVERTTVSCNRTHLRLLLRTGLQDGIKAYYASRFKTETLSS
jgi:hypothetical protein